MLIPQSMTLSIPLFPLPETVFFPKTILPLHVFEPRYKALVGDLLSQADQENALVGIPLLKPGHDDRIGAQPDVFPIFGYGTISEYERIADDRYIIILSGVGRARLIEEVASDKPYRMAHYEVIEENTESESTMKALEQQVNDIRMKYLPLLDDYQKISGQIRDFVKELRDPEIFCHFLSMNLIPSPLERQKILEMDSLPERLRHFEKTLVHLTLEKAFPVGSKN